MTTFSNLTFGPKPHGDGIQAVVEFPTGYGASIIQSKYSHGGDEGLYELAVLFKGRLDYSTPITGDVEGWLTEDDVTDLLRRIADLPPPQEGGE